MTKAVLAVILCPSVMRCVAAECGGAGEGDSGSFFGFELDKKTASGIIHSAALSSAACGVAAKTGLSEVCVASHISAMTGTLMVVGGCNPDKQKIAALVATAFSAYMKENAVTFAAKKLLSWLPGPGEIVDAAWAIAAVESIGWIIYGQMGCTT